MHGPARRHRPTSRPASCVLSRHERSDRPARGERRGRPRPGGGRADRLASGRRAGAARHRRLGPGRVGLLPDGPLGRPACATGSCAGAARSIGFPRTSSRRTRSTGRSSRPPGRSSTPGPTPPRWPPSLAAPWPFGGRAIHRVTLTPGGLRAELEVHAGDRPMPAIVGWHPWFRARAPRSGRSRRRRAGGRRPRRRGDAAPRRRRAARRRPWSGRSRPSRGTTASSTWPARRASTGRARSRCGSRATLRAGWSTRSTRRASASSRRPARRTASTRPSTRGRAGRAAGGRDDDRLAAPRLTAPAAGVAGRGRRQRPLSRRARRGKIRSKFATSCAPSSSGSSPRCSATQAAVIRTQAGSLRRRGAPGAERYGASVSTRSRSAGTSRTLSAVASSPFRKQRPEIETAQPSSRAAAT